MVRHLWDQVLNGDLGSLLLKERSLCFTIIIIIILMKMHLLARPVDCSEV